MAPISFNQFYRTALQGQAGNSTIKLNGNNGVKTTGWPTWKSTNRAAIDSFLASITSEYGQAFSNIIQRNLDMRAKPQPLKARKIIEIKTQLETLTASKQALETYFASEQTHDNISPAEAYLSSLLSEYEQQAGFSFGQLTDKKREILSNVLTTLTGNFQNNQAFSEKDAQACIRRELESHYPQIYMDKFFAQGMNDEPSLAEKYVNTVYNDVMEMKEGDDLPKEHLVNIKKTVLEKVKKELAAQSQNIQAFSEYPVKYMISDNIRIIYDKISSVNHLSMRETGKPLSPEVLRFLCFFAERTPDDNMKIMSKFLTSVLQTSDNSNLLDGSLENTKQLYREFCSRMDLEPENLETVQSMDILKKMFNRKIGELVYSNKNLQKDLQKVFQDMAFKPNASLESLDPKYIPFYEASLNALPELLEKRSDLKKLFPELKTEQGIANFVNNHIEEFSKAINKVVNNISQERQKVTVPLFSELVQKSLLNYFFETYINHVFGEYIPPDLDKLALSNKSYIDEAIKECKSFLPAVIPSDFKTSFCSLSTNPEQFLQTMEKNLNVAQLAIKKNILYRIARKEIHDVLLNTLKEECGLSDDEIKTVKTDRFRDKITIISGSVKHDSPVLNDFMEKFKEQVDKYVQKIKALLDNLNKLKSTLPPTPDIFKSMRAGIIKNHEEYPNADVLMRAQQIASQLDVSALLALGPKPSIQNVRDAVLHFALQVCMKKTKEEKEYPPTENFMLIRTTFQLAVCMHPELRDAMHQLSAKDSNDIKASFQNDSIQINSRIDYVDPKEKQATLLLLSALDEAEAYYNELDSLVAQKHPHNENVQ